ESGALYVEFLLSQLDVFFPRLRAVGRAYGRHHYRRSDDFLCRRHLSRCAGLLHVCLPEAAVVDAGTGVLAGGKSANRPPQGGREQKPREEGKPQCVTSKSFPW